MGKKELSRILIFGGTGYLGKYLVKASIKQGHETHIYGRPITTPNSNLSKVELLKEFQSLGVNIIHGELDEHDKLVDAIRQVDIVISALPFPQILDQMKIIHAIKVAGNVKRFIPSEFGSEEDRIEVLAPFQTYLDRKKSIRNATEESGVPYTFITANVFAFYFLKVLFRPHDMDIHYPVDHEESMKYYIYGTGQAKVVMNNEADIAMYTIKVANDPRTCNKTVFYRPPENITSQLALTSLWESKTGETLNKIFISEEELARFAETSPHPDDVRFAILHSIFAAGDTLGYELNPDDVEVTELYPEFEYTTIDKLMDDFIARPQKIQVAAF